MLSPDYAQFRLEEGKVIPGPRMLQKLQAVPIPDDLTGKSVLDVGCDYGQFSFLCANRGAEVVGIDRNRPVKGIGHVDLVAVNNAVEMPDCRFFHSDIGKQWHSFGKFDLVLMMSLYHHVFQNCGDHNAIWYWLWNHTKGELLWENPVDCSDAVVKMNMSEQYRKHYTPGEILGAAGRYFHAEKIGGAIHETTREVWRFTPKRPAGTKTTGEVSSGAGGATKAFEYADNRRAKEIEHALGFKPYPGSLNVTCEFDWDKNYYRSRILDVKDRMSGLYSPWEEKWCRFYPVKADGISAYAMRFEGEKYPQNFVELIAAERLSDSISGKVEICQ